MKIMLLTFADVDCGGDEVLKVIKFAMEMVDLVCFIVPIVLIVMIVIDFSKSVIANNEGDMTKNLQMVIKRIVMCVGLFIVPVIVRAVIFLLGNLGVDYVSCIDKARNTDFSQLEQKEKNE